MLLALFCQLKEIIPGSTEKGIFFFSFCLLELSHMFNLEPGELDFIDERLN